MADTSMNDFLDISKIESGKLELENILFDLQEVFIRCRTAVMPKALEKGVKLYFYAEPSVGKKLVGDPVRLSQVLINLISNAVEFTNVGMVKLLSSVKNSTNDSVTILFEVKDICMTPEQIHRVCEPSARVDDDAKRKCGGTEPGLSMIKNIITLMSGNLTVESVTDTAGKFSFDLTFNTINSYADVSDREIISDQDEKLRIKLLTDFTKRNQTKFTEIVKAVGEGDIKLAHRLAHTLKGNAGLIGKPELRAAAEDVEQILKTGVDAIWESKMSRLNLELESVLEEFEPLLKEYEPAAQKEIKHLTVEETLALFDQLAFMLDNINPACLDLLNEIRAVPGTEELANQIENIDFEAAAITLAELKETLV